MYEPLITCPLHDIGPLSDGARELETSAGHVLLLARRANAVFILMPRVYVG
jgi:hypothetical protein